ncbi:MAG TPA: ATP-binding cassette domain-containing protein, partial [Bryobacteraceae bacterium]|nr:ATP-binding cassette domain-containing protein [Bryobacteraceae bacterium]
MFSNYIDALSKINSYRRTGRVREMTGLVVASYGPAAGVGEFCEIVSSSGRAARAQVVGFRDGRVLLIPLDELTGLQPGDTVIARPGEDRVEVGLQLLGRILDGFGKPMDGGPSIEAEASYDLYAPAPGPLEREHITEPLVTGVRAIDSLLPFGKGQRIGIFGGSGVGKSTLLGALARHHSADVGVIALIGER